MSDTERAGGYVRNISRQRAKSLLLASFFLAAAPAVVQAADGDVDNDGLSDITLVARGSDGLAWSAALSSRSFGSDTADLSNIGATRSNPIVGYWTSADTLETGAVSVKNKALEWSVQPASGGAASMITFGRAGDTVLSGADFDGNGISDIARVTANGAVELYTNPFAGGSVQSLSIPKKLAKQSIPFFYRASGNGDQLAFLRLQGKKKRKTVQVSTLGADGTLSSVDWGRMSGSVARVLPVATEGGTDNLIVLRGRSGNRYEVINPADGTVISSGGVGKKATVLAGNFLSDSGEELAVVSAKGGAQFVNPVTGGSSQASLPEASVYVDQVSIGKILSSSQRKRSSSSASGGLARVCPRGTRSVPGGVLWKPDADAKLGPPRAGKPVILFQSGKPGSGSIDIYAKNGQKVCSAGFKAPSDRGINCNSDHYYVGWSGGCGLTDGGIASAARKASGSTSVYFKGSGGVCYGPINPSSRSGGLGC